MTTQAPTPRTAALAHEVAHLSYEEQAKKFCDLADSLERELAACQISLGFEKKTYESAATGQENYRQRLKQVEAALATSEAKLKDAKAWIQMRFRHQLTMEAKLSAAEERVTEARRLLEHLFNECRQGVDIFDKRANDQKLIADVHGFLASTDTGERDDG